jgi:hypothetical protein
MQKKNVRKLVKYSEQLMIKRIMGRLLFKCIMLLIMHRMGMVHIHTMLLIMIIVILFIMHIIVQHTKYLQPWNMQPQVFLTSIVPTSIKLTL